MAKSIFRKTAIDRLSSPEQLDRLVPVTDGKSWLALFILISMIAAAIAWSFLGSLPSRVSGQGILITEGGRVFVAVAPLDGELEDITVSVDDIVEKGQVVAVMSQEALEQDLLNTEETLTDLTENLEQVEAEVAETERLRIQAIDRQIEATNLQVTAAQARVESAAEQLEIFTELLDEGRVTRSAVIERQSRLDSEQQTLDDLNQRLVDLQLSRFEGNVGDRQRIESAQREVNEITRQRNTLLRQLERSTTITSPDAGRVTELQASAGSLLGRGQAAVALESLGEGLELLLYIAPQDGKSVTPGMKVQISPDTAAREEFGTVLGTVKEVSDFPSTPDGMMAILRDEGLVSKFRSEGPPYRAFVALEPDDASESGYRWTSQRGQLLDLKSGTLASAEVTIRTQRPIEMVIPLLRDWTGL